MKIAILNGNPAEENSSFDQYLRNLQGLLTGRGNQCELLNLRELDAGYCTGCWSCWVKTPGRCSFADDSDLVCRAVINSDFVLFASPIRMGFLSAVLKKFMDKLIPLVHPYTTVVQGEAHHRCRYAAKDYPLGGLLLEKTPGTDHEDIEIIQAIQARTMLNLRTRNVFTMLTDHAVEDVVDAILRC
ncbi:MAG: NAD(P)H-dependent oxidoreductase [Brevefilum sp.]|nr:NAD(P)H-dependent oxidoreductase [Brevefilum sp.]